MFAASIYVEAVPVVPHEWPFCDRAFGHDVIQIVPWVYIMYLTGSQQGTDDRHIDCRLMVSAEEKTFSAQSDGALNVFRQIVIPIQAAIVQASHNIIPFGIGICNGLACQRTWTVFNDSVSLSVSEASLP